MVNTIEIPKADKCNQLYETMEGNLVQAHIALGAELHMIKMQLPRGEFTSWVEENCKFSRQTASRCIKCWRNRHRQKVFNFQTIRELLNEKKDDRVEIRCSVTILPNKYLKERHKRLYVSYGTLEGSSIRELAQEVIEYGQVISK
jgi:hypothetical protein